MIPRTKPYRPVYSAAPAQFEPVVFRNPGFILLNPIFWICAFFIVDGILILRILPRVGTGICFLGFLMTASMQPNALRIFASPKMMWVGIGYTLLYFAFARLIEYGPFNGYTVGLIFYRLLRVMPILLMGIYIANTRHGVFWGIATMLAVNGTMSLLMVRYGIQFEVETGQTAARVMHTEGMTMDAALAGVGGVHQAAARAYIFILAVGFYLSARKQLSLSTNIAFLALFGMLGLGVLFSGFTAPMLLIIIAGGLIAAFQFFRIRTLVFSLVFMGLLAAGYIMAELLQMQIILNQFDKAISLLSIPFGGGSEGRELADVDRYQLFMISLSTFMNSPVFGVGGYLYIGGDVLGGSNPLGGHSTFIDWPAQFGIIGIIGLIVIGISIYKNLRYIRISGRAKAMGPFALVLKVYFLVWLIHSVGNPNLATANIDVMTAFTLGLLHGFARTPGLFAALEPPRIFHKKGGLFAAIKKPPIGSRLPRPTQWRRPVHH